jgi:hypothetical protein
VGYPFLPVSTVIPPASQLGGDAQTQLATMTSALSNLAQYVPVQNGEYWLAVGLDVTSFEMIQVSAVLSVAFGVEFQIGVVGTASMTLPVAEPEPIAYVQIDFEIAVTPSAGLVAAFGKITPASFLYGGFVHISGGFAFSAWFSGENSGNFVMTVGGYNTAYAKPDIYPDVPRIQITYGINSLNVTGDAYFALVPHALMAGLAIHATWSLGPINAWFDAGVDFLLQWKPFHYEADAYVHIGISLNIKVLFVKVRITVHVGVDLDIWGPPFGGRAVVDLDIVSITISFGDAQVRKSVGWNEFSGFLPSVNSDSSNRVSRFDAVPSDSDNKPLVNVSVSPGLVKAFNPGESPEHLDWLVDPNSFAITTQSVAPCTDATFNSTASLKTLPTSDYVNPDDLASTVAAAINNGEQPPLFAYEVPTGGASWTGISIGIPPMQYTNVQSVHTVLLRTLDAQGNVGAEVQDLIVELQTASFSTALWGNSGSGSAQLNGNELIAGALSGFKIVPMLWFPKRTSFIPYYYLVFDTNNLFLEQDTLPAIQTGTFSDPQTIYDEMEAGTAFQTTGAARASILGLLQQNGFASLSLQNDTQMNTGQYTADPILTLMSATNEANAVIAS